MWEERSSSSRWDPVTVTEIDVHGKSVTVVTDRLRKGYSFACSVEDIQLVLNALPKKDVDGIGLVALHQQSSKENTFRSFWGCINWITDFRGYSGPTIALSAFEHAKPQLTWGRKLSPQEQAELERLRTIGFKVEESRKAYKIYLDLKTVRRYQLLYTLPHEVGHWVDYLRLVVEPAKASSDPDETEYQLFDKFFTKRPTKDKEDAAWRYVKEVSPILKRLESLL